MHKPTSPFTREQLLPKEETLELTKEKGTLFIGIPKETSFQEKRVCLTPDAVSALTCNGHRLLIESGAGENERVPLPLIAKSLASVPVSEYESVEPASASVAPSE